MKKLIYISTIFLLLALHTGSANTEWNYYYFEQDIKQMVETDESIWLLTPEAGLIKFDKKSGEIERINSGNSNLNSNRIACIAADNDNGLWGVTYTDNYWTIDFENLHLGYKIDKIFNINNGNMIIYKDFNNIFNSIEILADNAGNLHLLFYNYFFWGYSRLYTLDGSKLKLILSIGEKKHSTKLSNLWAASDGSFWCINNFNGIVNFSDSTDLTTYSGYFPTDTISDFIITDEGRIYMACYKDSVVGNREKMRIHYGLTGFDTESKAASTFDTTNSKIPANEIEWIEYGEDGLIWLKHPGRILSSFDGDSFAVYDLNIMFSEDLDLPVPEIFKKNSKWGANERGVYAFHEDGYQEYIISDLGFSPDVDMKTDSDGNLCFGHENVVIKHEVGTWNKVFADTTDIDQYVFDKSNDLWVISDLQLKKVTGDNKISLSIEIENDPDGITPVIDDMAVDAESKIWFSASQELVFEYFRGMAYEKIHYEVGRGMSYIDGEELTSVPPLLNRLHKEIFFDEENNLWSSCKREDTVSNKYFEYYRETEHCGLMRVQGIDLPNPVYDFFEHGNNYIQNIVGDSKGNIWCSCEDALLKLENDEFTLFSADNSFLPSHTIIDLAIDSRDNVWIATSKHLVKFSVDGNWEILSSEISSLPEELIRDIEIDRYDNIWIQTGQRLVAYRKGGVILSAEEEAFQPTDLRLSAYPNPFSQSTTINYELREAGYISLELFDMLGNKIATLVDGFMPAGRHEARFEAAGLPEGVYFLKLQAGGELVTRKVVKF